MLAVLGATSSVITICETCVAVVRFIQECQPTEAIAVIEPQLVLLLHIIKQLKPLYLDSPGHDIVAVLSGCEKELQNLKNLIEDYYTTSSLSLFKRTQKSFKIPIWERKIRQNWTRIQQYQMSISLYLNFYSTKQLLNAPRTEASLFLVPFHQSNNFYGQQDILDQISNSIRYSTQSPCVFSLTGYGGTGKTEIAREFCLREKEAYQMIIWLNAADETSFTTSILDFANAVSVNQRKFNDRGTSLAYIQDVAKDRTQPWLFVLDGWDSADQKYNIFQFLADGGQRDVILATTRHPKPCWGTQIKIQPLSNDDGARFFLGFSHSPGQNQMEAARMLTSRVGGLPLALAQMSGFMKSQGYTPEELLTSWDSGEILQQMKSTSPVAESMLAILEELKREDYRLIEFLLQLSLFALPVECIFRDYFLLIQSRAESLPSFYQLFVHKNQWSSELFFHAVMKFRTLYLVEQRVRENGVMVLSIHRVIKEFLHREVSQSKIIFGPQLMLQTTAIIAAPLAIHDWDKSSICPRNIFRENIMECFQQRISILNSPDLIKRYSGISEGYQTSLAAFLARYSNEEEQARSLLLESLSLQSAWLGESASLTCTTMTWLALLYLECMLLDEAAITIDRLNTAESQASKPQKTHLVDVQLLKGHLQMRKQNIAHALSIFEHCTEHYAQITGVSSVGIVSALVSGGEAMLIQGNVEDATQNLYDAENIQKAIDIPHALVFRLKWNLARHSLRRGDHIRATSRYKDLCDEHELNNDSVGPPSRRLASLRCELGDVYLDLGDVQKAKEEYDIGKASAKRRSKSWKINLKDTSQWLLYASLERTKSLPLRG